LGFAGKLWWHIVNSATCHICDNKKAPLSRSTPLGGETRIYPPVENDSYSASRDKKKWIGWLGEICIMAYTLFKALSSQGTCQIGSFSRIGGWKSGDEVTAGDGREVAGD
jgi:hypothetical protein